MCGTAAGTSGAHCRFPMVAQSQQGMSSSHWSDTVSSGACGELRRTVEGCEGALEGAVLLGVGVEQDVSRSAPVSRIAEVMGLMFIVCPLCVT